MAERVPLVWVDGFGQRLPSADSLTPPSHNTTDIGTSSTQWRTLYSVSVVTTSCSVTSTSMTTAPAYVVITNTTGAPVVGTPFFGGLYSDFGPGPSLSLAHARGTPVSPAATQSSDVLGRIDLGGYDTTNGFSYTGQIQALATENWTSTAHGTRMRFRTVLAGTTTATAAFEIDANQNLVPGSTATMDLGTSSVRWRNIYAGTIAIGNASHDPTGLTATRTYTYPNMSGVFAMASQLPTSGTYTPTLANVANVASSSSNSWRYARTGDVVMLGGTISLTPTAASTTTQLSITVPVASTMASTVDDASGVVSSQQNIGNGAFIRSDGSGKLFLQFTSAGTSLVSLRIQASYNVN